MKPRLIGFYLKFAAAILFITAFAKIYSSFGHTPILESVDPVLMLSHKIVFFVVGIFEIAIALFCCFGVKIELNLVLISWYATVVSAYRVALYFGSYRKPCSCLGNLTDDLHIQPKIADTTMKILLVYLLIGSYAALFWLWRQQRKPSLS